MAVRIEGEANMRVIMAHFHALDGEIGGEAARFGMESFGVAFDVICGQLLAKFAGYIRSGRCRQNIQFGQFLAYTMELFELAVCAEIGVTAIAATNMAAEKKPCFCFIFDVVPVRLFMGILLEFKFGGPLKTFLRPSLRKAVCTRNRGQRQDGFFRQAYRGYR